MLWLSLSGLPYSGARPQKISNSFSDFHQEIWNTDSGLPQNNVLAIAQGKDGYLWVGTELGLARFDGLQFTIFDKTNTPQLKSNKINALLPDNDGTLWIGTESGGLAHLVQGKFQAFTAKDGLSSGSIRCLLQDSTGDIWIGTGSTGLNRWHEGKLSAFTTGNGLSDNHIQALAQAPDGTIWIGTHNGLSSYRSGAFQNFSTGDGLASNYIRSLLASSAGTLWIGTEGGLSRLADGRFTNSYIKDGLSSNSVSTLALDESGTLWIGTLGGGISRLSGGNLSAYLSRTGLPALDIWSIVRDRRGSLWVGTSGGGLVRIDNQLGLSFYGKDEGLPSNVALPIFQDHEGTVWIGTNGGGLSRFRDGQFQTYTAANGLAGDIVFSLCEDSQGTLWIGTRNGVSTYKNGVFTTFAKKDMLPGIVMALFSGSDGAVWMGTRAGLVRWKDNHFATFTVKDGLSSDVIRTIYEDRKHRLWIGTVGGLNLFANDRFRVFDGHNGLSSNVVMAIHETPDGTLWIGTDGGGLNRFREGHFVSFTSKDGLLDDSIFRILGDGDGGLWMSSNKGLAHIQEAALNDFAAGRRSHIPVLSYDNADGMRTRECNGGFQPAGWRTTDGKLWFPTMKGVAVVDPSKLVPNITQQPTLIEKMIVNQKVLLPGSAAEVPVEGGNLEVHYTAINFRAPSRLNFEYRLLGYQADWVPAQQRRIAYYTNLPPGHYQFQVRASNDDNTWSTSAAVFPITFQPHFYQTLLFDVLCSFGVIGLAAFGHREYTRQLHERERILEQHVHERTAELRKEMAEREFAQREAIRAREAAEQASRVKSEFLANMSHEIRTPMNGILGMTRLTLASGPNPKQQQYLEIIKESADSLLLVIDDILDFSKVEAGKLELHPIPVNVRRIIEAVVKTLALRAEQKQVALSYHIESEVPSVVHLDPLRLRQVILNLLGNALKFTDRGEVMLSVSCDSQMDAKAALHFVVSDTGIGIATENLNSIFEAFSQADSSTTRRYGGTGLGLAICHRLVHLMGGEIWATSELGRGSQFHFTTPADIPECGTPEELLTPEAISHGHSLRTLATVLKGHVLVAEDNPANRMVAKYTLEAAGFLVHDVENGSDALEAVQRMRFDLLLMDCRMPVMDGYVATEKIRQLEGAAALIPIIALTASAFPEDRERAQLAGMNDFIAKPFAEGDLIRKCVFWLGENRASSREDVHDGESNPANVNRADAPSNLGQGNFLEGTHFSPDFLKDMLEVFLQSAPPVFARLQEAVETRDWVQAREAAHWLRGGATRLAGPETQGQLAKLEALLRADSPVVNNSELISLTRSFDKICAEAEKWLAQHRVPASID